MMQGERTLAGRYDIGRRIGRGGMAEVYLGTDERLGRRVAVKLLNTQLSGEPDFRSRFRQEAQAAARMTHPTIVRVFDAGEDTFVRADGHELVVPYIVMEYIEGQQLRDVMAGAPLADTQIHEYMTGILTALEYSHRAGVVHRDIKPGNIMITPEDTVKVMDFGIARAISDTAGTIAQTTAILGTASYFSPEQAKGENVDGRSDLYSAGIVLYEMLTGKVPFQGDSAVAVAYQHVTERPIDANEINPKVSKAMNAVVKRSLAKNREDRYQSASEFRRDLDLAAQGIMPAFATKVEDDDRTQLFGPAPSGVSATESAFNSLSETDDRAPQVQRRPPAMWIWGAAALLVVVIVAVSIWVSSLPQVGQLPDTSVDVPDVVGEQWDAARTTLEDAGLTPVRAAQTSDEVPENQVISTTPGSGLSVSPGQEITVLVSTGPSAVTMPDINGMTVEQATVALQGAGLSVGQITSEDSPTVAAGTIVRSDPAGGSSVAAGSSVNLVTSTGNVALPDLIGQPLESATATLRELGLLAVVKQDPGCLAVDGDPIVNMSVPPGPVAQHSQVEVTYCTSVPAPPETTAPAPEPTSSAGPSSSTEE